MAYNTNVISSDPVVQSFVNNGDLRSAIAALPDGVSLGDARQVLNTEEVRSYISQHNPSIDGITMLNTIAAIETIATQPVGGDRGLYLHQKDMYAQNLSQSVANSFADEIVTTTASISNGSVHPIFIPNKIEPAAFGVLSQEQVNQVVMNMTGTSMEDLKKLPDGVTLEKYTIALNDSTVRNSLILSGKATRNGLDNDIALLKHLNNPLNTAMNSIPSDEIIAANERVQAERVKPVKLDVASPQEHVFQEDVKPAIGSPIAAFNRAVAQPTTVDARVNTPEPPVVATAVTSPPPAVDGRTDVLANFKNMETAANTMVAAFKGTDEKLAKLAAMFNQEGGIKLAWAHASHGTNKAPTQIAAAPLQQTQQHGIA